MQSKEQNNHRLTRVAEDVVGKGELGLLHGNRILICGHKPLDDLVRAYDQNCTPLRMPTLNDTRGLSHFMNSTSSKRMQLFLSTSSKRIQTYKYLLESETSSREYDSGLRSHTGIKTLQR
jgi:hypothetical protein